MSFFISVEEFSSKSLSFYFLTFGRKSENRIKKTRRNAVILCDFHWFFMLSQYTVCALAWWLMEINYCNFTDIRFSFLVKGKTNTNTPNSRNFQGEQSCFTSNLVIYSDIFRQFYMFHLLGGWCRFWILFLIHFRITSFFLLEISLVLFKTTIETEKIIPIIFLFEKNWKIKLVLSFVDNTYVHREPVECKINFYILKNKKLVLFSRILIILLVKCWAK